MQVYELGYLILPSIAEDALSGVIDKIRALINEVGGKELDGEAPFKYPLAYSMSKTIGASRYVLSDAYLGWIKFDLPANSGAGVEHPVETIKKGVEKIEEILRFLLIKAPRETFFTFAKARAMVENKEEPASVEDSGVAKEAVVY